MSVNPAQVRAAANALNDLWASGSSGQRWTLDELDAEAAKLCLELERLADTPSAIEVARAMRIAVERGWCDQKGDFIWEHRNP